MKLVYIIQIDFLTGKNDDFQFARVSLVSMSNIAELEVGLIRLRAYLKKCK